MSTARTTRETYLQNKVKKGLSLSNRSEIQAALTPGTRILYHAAMSWMYVCTCVSVYVCSVVLDYYLHIFLSN